MNPESVIDTVAETIEVSAEIPAEELSAVSKVRLAAAEAKRTRRGQRALAEQAWRTPLTPVQREALERGLADAKAGRVHAMSAEDLAATCATADQCED